MPSPSGKAPAGLQNRDNKPVCKWAKNPPISNLCGIGVHPMDKENINPKSKDQRKGFSLDDGEDGNIEVVMAGHTKMMQIFGSRLIKLRTAMAFWADENYTNLVSFLTEAQDNGVLVDMLPRLTEKMKPTEQLLSLDNRSQLLLLVSRLLHSPYEDYVDRGLDFLIALTKSFKSHEKLKTTEKGTAAYSHIKSMHTELCQIELGILRKLKVHKGTVGRKAKFLDTRILLLCH